jgi:predicted CXXCH cytochrome family protein
MVTKKRLKTSWLSLAKAALLILIVSAEPLAVDSESCRGCHEKACEATVASPYLYYDARKECARCHVYTEPLKTEDAETAHGCGFLPPMDSRIEACNACHPHLGISHPVGIASRGEGIKVPDALPTVDGKTTCVTCHTPHGGSSKYLERLDSYEGDLCIQRHIAPGFVRVRVCRKAA